MQAVQSTPTCYTKYNSAEAAPTIIVDLSYKSIYVCWGDCIKDVRVTDQNIVETHSTIKKEPQNDNWSENEPNFMSSIVLQCEKAYQNGTCKGNCCI